MEPKEENKWRDRIQMGYGGSLLSCWIKPDLKLLNFSVT